MFSYQDIDNFNEWAPEVQDQFTLNVLKGLIMDGVRKANSGHTGGCLSSADFAFILFTEYLKFNPQDPEWFARDRFVLSAGHESMLLYSLLYMIGWLNKTDLQNFRQLHSRTPGHPEVEIPGVEATTGPLGQGFGMGIGMAVAESMLRATFGKHTEKANELVGHFTYILAGDGDFQEPITMGVAALAGHWCLSRLIVFYDSNEAQISGKTNRVDSTNYFSLFESFNWHVQEIDGHNHEQIREAIEKARVVEQPSLIIGKTTMAYGCARMEGDHNTHGTPLPYDEIEATKKKLGLPDKKFYTPNEAVTHFRVRFSGLKKAIKYWKKSVNSENEIPEVKKLWDFCTKNKLPKLVLPGFKTGENLATRKAFGVTLDKIAEQIPILVGGSADLEPSNYTGNFAETYGDYQAGNRTGRNIAFGVREFPMATIMNGIALHGGLIPFGGTFLVFSDYERPALRLAALQKLRVIHEFTHDSFYVGEDGPTHQPVEHIMALRAIPDFQVFRPAEAKETVAVFELALKSRQVPSALLLTRQGVPVLDLSMNAIKIGVSRGAYTVHDCDGSPELVLLATGSEVSLALAVARKMQDKLVRVVSMPCWERFDQQPLEYQRNLIPSNRNALIISIEAGITLGWEKYVGFNGFSIGLNQFGASAPAKELARYFGFTPDQVEKKIRDFLGES